MIRAKFAVTAITRFAYDPQGCEIEMKPRYDDSIPGDRRFEEVTPTGKLTMTIRNPAVLGELDMGRESYLDFTPTDTV
jgi:hypothetical protein